MRPIEFDDPAFLDRLRRGDAVAYRSLIRRSQRSMTSVAASMVGSQARSDGDWIEEQRLLDDIRPERSFDGSQLWDLVQEFIETLPPGQRAVLVLRDMGGQAAEEACDLLKLTAENQSVLLHRACRVHRAVDATTCGAWAAATAKPAIPSPRAASRRGRTAWLMGPIRLAVWARPVGRSRAHSGNGAALR
jgi:hypothetical protein